MSAFAPQPTHSDGEKLATGGLLDQIALGGQKHDRIENQSSEGFGSGPGAGGNGEPAVDISAGQKMLSAVSGSLLTSILVTPLDVVRVRLQSQPPPSSSASALRALPHPPSTQPFTNLPPNLGVTACCREVFWVNNNAQFCMVGPTTTGVTHASTTAAAECAVEETQRKSYTSTFDGLRKIARNEGLGTLWRGLSPTLVMAVPANVIYFTGYDLMRTSEHSPIKQYVSDSYSPLIAGSIARVAAALAVSPIEMLRTRMQASSSGSASSVLKETLKGLNDMVHVQGYTSLWRGLTLTMWRDVPFSGIYWWGYEAVRNSLTDARERSNGRGTKLASSQTRVRSLSRSQENHTATFVDSFIAGAASGGVAAVVTTPFDVGKTRQQVSQHAGESSSSSSVVRGDKVLRPEERSMPRFLYHIFQEEGAAGLFRGWAARCLKVAPACAIMISSYEIGKKMAKNMNERRDEQKNAI
ncbi:MAG: hypothetical protein M1827_006307 [Pycnora praestabilis]|nr:MAG: hypothetical protein M1827_006307 [Pycnora praestabilis]